MKISKKQKDFWLFVLEKNLQEKLLEKIAAQDQALHITYAIKMLKPTGDNKYKMYQ
jgi:hypothetical protein